MSVIFQVPSNSFIENYFSSENSFNNTANKQQSTCCCQICLNKLGTMPAINTVQLPYDNIPITVSEETANVSCQNGCKFHSQCIFLWLQVNSQQENIAMEEKTKCPFCDNPSSFGLRNIYSQIILNVAEKEMHSNKKFMTTDDAVTVEVEQNNNKHQISTNENTTITEEEEHLDYYLG